MTFMNEGAQREESARRLQVAAEASARRAEKMADDAEAAYEVTMAAQRAALLAVSALHAPVKRRSWVQACRRRFCKHTQVTAGMAEVIAAHRWHEVKLGHDTYLIVCTGCHWGKQGGADSRHEAHAAHLAEELAKAGYGQLALHDIGS